MDPVGLDLEESTERHAHRADQHRTPVTAITGAAYDIDGAGSSSPETSYSGAHTGYTV
jgi:hypothetical protein